MKTESRTSRAFRDPLNWFGGVLVAGGVYLATQSPVTAIAAWALYEAAYLLLVTRTPWFVRRIGGERLADRAMPSLLEEDRALYAELGRLREGIARGLPGGETWDAEIVGQLDGLREQFVRFATKRAEYQALLRGLALELGAAPLDPFGKPLPPRGRERALAAADIAALSEWIREGFERRLADANQEMLRESDPEGRALVEKRRDLTSQLRESADGIVQTARNVERQLDLVGDTFRLVHAQFRSHPPEQLVPQVEEAVRTSRALADALEELAPLEERIQRLGRA